MKEAGTLARVLLAIGGRQDARLWRQHAGKARSFYGHAILQLAPDGAADTVGIIATPCHCGCGRVYGLHLAIETKGTTGRQSKDQKAFQSMIERFGGIYVLARSIEDVHEQLRSRGYVCGHEPARVPAGGGDRSS